MKKNKETFIQSEDNSRRILCVGDWILVNLTPIKSQLNSIKSAQKGKIAIDGSGIETLDSAGAWLLSQWQVDKKRDAKLENFSEKHQQLIKLVEDKEVSGAKIPHVKHKSWLEKVGRSSVSQCREFYDYLNFVGMLSMEMLRVITHPSHFRWKALASIIYKTGFQALPIIGLLSFMIGVVIAYQMGNQLRAYGANVLIVDLLGLAVLREFGPLITAIMVAGRTGSAYTAELGIMKLNQEIDALDTMGVTPAELLLIPRMLGLFITLPLLSMWANMFGIMGGMVMANNLLSITPHDFLARFQTEIPMRALLIGLCKAPVFALIIASIGCFQGMEVEMNSDSVGKKTTRSVVLSIFFIIIVDAVFSVIFSRLNL